MGEVLKAIWFVTRKYPPTPGGMEKLARQIASALTAHGPFVLVRWSRSQMGLPLFMAWAAFRILCGRASRSIAVLYLGDPVLSVLGMLARKSGIPVVVTVHGLDVLFPSRAYQRYLRRFFWNRFDGYVCISQHVADVLAAGGVPAQRIRVLQPGIDLPRSSGGPTMRDTGPAKLLLLGRLVARKGAAWFVGEVLPKVVACHPDVTIAIVGEGPERPKIEALIAHHRLHQHVQLCGRVDDATIGRLLAECAAVVMPNIPVSGDTEGFGLVALEAGAAGKPVFAADLEGLRDAVRDGENGCLIPAGDADAWAEALNHALSDRAALASLGARACHFVARHYDWSQVGKRYAAVVAEFAHG